MNSITHNIVLKFDELKIQRVLKIEAASFGSISLQPSRVETDFLAFCCFKEPDAVVAVGVCEYYPLADLVGC